MSDRSTPVRERLVSVIGAIAGVEIVGAAHGALAVAESVKRFEPDVVVMDVGVRPMEELVKLRKLKGRRGVPVVILRVDDLAFPSREKWLRAGVDFVFHRSKEFQEAFKVIEEMAKAVVTTGKSVP